MKARNLLVPCALLLLTAPGQACEPAPEALRDITANRYYIDSAGSIIDPALQAKDAASTAPFNDYLKTVSGLSDAYVARGDAAAARCALAWLSAWAKGGAMLGIMANAQAEYERKWTLAGLALAYLKLRSAVRSSDRAIIDPWLDALATRAEAFFDDPHRRRNNHYYWVGLAAGATALATGEARHWAYAERTYRDAMEAVQPDGTLPLEMARRGRALLYHNYALAPLVLIAELGKQKGLDLYADHDGAIHRLAARVISGIADPAGFAKLSGIAPDEVPKGSALAWLAFYARRFPGRVKGLAVTTHPFVNPRLGGDVQSLAAKWVR